MARISEERNGESALSQEPYQPITWNLAFVQDCNLRCKYCVTGHGRLGHGSKFMQPGVWRKLCDLILSMSACRQRIYVDFGVGETFLHFDEAMRFLDHLRQQSDDKGVQVEALITTNGTLATVEQLEECLKKKVSLSFSIDGSASTHDSFRRFADGRPTHRIALKNWRRYRAMVGSVDDAPGCTISSVVAGDTRLRDVARFWRKQGVRQFKAIPVEQSKHLGCFNQQELNAVRHLYLDDLEVIASVEVARLRDSELIKNFEGPAGILRSWMHLSRAEPYRSCGGGYTMICVDAEGTLFPCQGFVGFAERSIGDVYVGVLPAKLKEFRSAKSQVQAQCGGCWARFLCDGGCCAGDPKTGLVLGAWDECEFTKSHAEIAIKTYQTWCRHRMMNAETEKERQVHRPSPAKT